MEVPTATLEAVDRSGVLLKGIGERMSEGLLVVAEDRTVAFASTRAVELLRLPPDCAGRSLASLNADYRLSLSVDSCFDHGVLVERSLSSRGGSHHTILQAIPVGLRDAVHQVAVLVRDDSRQRRLDALRRDFIANVSHELRTPATAIKLMVETLEAGAIDDAEAVREFVEKIGEEAAHMERLIVELLELGAAESGPPTEGRSGPDELLGALDRLRPLADARVVVIDTAVEPGTPPVVGQASRLGQALRNLVHNAIKFSPRGGRVTVDAAPSADSSSVVIRITDRGPGIPPDDLPRIFERFWKGDASRRRDGEGFGLGLAIARHIVESHGGAITVASTPPDGATFSVRLPAAREAGSSS